ncbi:MAG TPA: ABC transporter permease [Puia sp.]|nr:ABC transporter permease [Puia sp.]
MFKTNLRIAWRNLLKDRQFTFLNWIGLAGGIAGTILIGLWVNDEIRTDDFHRSQLFQVMQNGPLDNGELMTIEHTPDLLADALRQQMPEVWASRIRSRV